MNILRSRPLTALAAIAVITGSVSAHAGSTSGAEVMAGWYQCGIGEGGQGFVWTSFQSTGDLLPESFSLQREIHAAANPQETCGALAAGAHQIVQAAGCTVGPHQASVDESGASDGFSFLCHDQRSRLTQILADLGSSILTTAP
jgi:hypothetical protein